MCNTTKTEQHLTDARDERVLQDEDIIDGASCSGPFGKLAKVDLPPELLRKLRDISFFAHKRTCWANIGNCFNGADVNQTLAPATRSEMTVVDRESVKKLEPLGEYLKRKGVDLESFDDEKLSQFIKNQMEV